MRPIWYAGTCDSLLAKVKAWHERYGQGQVHSTRQFLDFDGKIVNKPTKMIHTIAFIKQEIDNLVVFTNYYCKDLSLKVEVLAVADQWNREGKLLPGGLKKISLAFFPEHVEAIYQLISKARRDYLSGGSVEEKIQEAKDSGKDLFEI